MTMVSLHVRTVHTKFNNIQVFKDCNGVATRHIVSEDMSPRQLRLMPGTNIGWIESWSKRNGFGADSVQKYEDSETKIRFPQVRMLARPVLGLARPCHPPEHLLLGF
ncbi:hypothetical protein MTR_6g033360 [Medicago truncatula]|uniref:Uncharacterized protein n=1 Tax=Medicago truncatula TaxID=3880 RepID=A0A072U8F2_MEDTR|nr:hypothetical protein MTR_6g033360 [Medicago truncatula]